MKKPRSWWAGVIVGIAVMLFVLYVFRKAFFYKQQALSQSVLWITNASGGAITVNIPKGWFAKGGSLHLLEIGTNGQAGISAITDGIHTSFSTAHIDQKP